MQDHRIASADISDVTAHVHQAAIDVLGPVTDPQTVHQAKFSMGTVLGLIATRGRAGLAEFDACLGDAAVRDFAARVRMELDAEVDGAYPARWIGKVTVTTRDGRRIAARVDEPKGDPGNTLSRDELEDKARRLGAYRAGASDAEMRRIIDTVWGMGDLALVGDLLPAAGAMREAA
jgi:2-methylcitrate dehydratase PrpD